MSNKSLYFYGISLVICLSFGCAQVVTPSGGPKDTKPPKAISFNPENKSTHFSTNRISIKFNKYIQLKDLPNQLVVSPPLKRFPTAVIKKVKILELTLKDTLKENTTYTFNFGNSIADINEGNVLSNFQYVFSTGNHLDSIKLIGKVQDAFTGDIQKDALVMLYANQSDSAPYKVMPSYCGRTDANGNYRVENIKNGTYSIAVLSKADNGYFYHLQAEGIGFSDKLLKLERNDTANISLFIEEETKFHFIKAKALEKGKVLIVFSCPADSLSIKPLNLPETKDLYTLLQYSATRDSVYYWINTPNLDSLHFIVARNGKNLDTVNIYSFPGVKRVGLGKKGYKPISLKSTCNVHANQSDYDYHKPIVFQAEHPLRKYDMSRVHLTQGRDTVKFKIDTTGMPFMITINCNLKSDSSYKFFILPRAFTDVFGLVNDTMIIPFKVQDPSFFGSLQLNLNFEKKGSYIIQLLDDQSKVFKQNIVDKAKSINYDALPPGNFRIRAIYDANNDGKWTTGNYLKKIQPEKIFYYPQLVTVRSNWDLTQDWLVK